MPESKWSGDVCVVARGHCAALDGRCGAGRRGGPRAQRPCHQREGAAICSPRVEAAFVLECFAFFLRVYDSVLCFFLCVRQSLVYNRLVEIPRADPSLDAMRSLSTRRCTPSRSKPDECVRRSQTVNLLVAHEGTGDIFWRSNSTSNDKTVAIH